MAVRKRKEDLIVAALEKDGHDILSDDEEIFGKIMQPHVAMLLRAARKAIAHEKRLGNPVPDVLQPEELVDETILCAWQARQGRYHLPFKNWLLDMQQHTLQRIIAEEQQLRETVPISLEAPVAPVQESDDENEYWEWVEPPVADRWADVIPDENIPLRAA